MQFQKKEDFNRELKKNLFMAEYGILSYEDLNKNNVIRTGNTDTDFCFIAKETDGNGFILGDYDYHKKPSFTFKVINSETFQRMVEISGIKANKNEEDEILQCKNSLVYLMRMQEELKKEITAEVERLNALDKKQRENKFYRKG